MEVQLWKHNDDRKRGFTINIGVIPDGWVEVVHPEWIEKDPGLVRFPHMGPVHTRLGYLAGHTEDLWWTISRVRRLSLAAIFGRKDVAAEVTSEVRESLRQYGLPWLDRFRDVGDLIAWLGSRQEEWDAGFSPPTTHSRLWTLGVLHHLAGQPDAAREHFDKAIIQAARGEWRAPGEPGALARELRKRLLGT